MGTIDLNELATFITQAQKLQDKLHDINYHRQVDYARYPSRHRIEKNL